MGSVVTPDVSTEEGVPVDRMASCLGRARSVLHRADEVFGTCRPASPMSRPRRGEVTPDGVPPEIALVPDACRAVRDLTDGWFDRPDACGVRRRTLGAVATSGAYERRSHLFDPRTHPAAAVAGVPLLPRLAAVDGVEAPVVGHDGGRRSTVGSPLAAVAGTPWVAGLRAPPAMHRVA